MRNFLKRFLLVTVVVILTFLIVFVRPNLSQAEVEQLYATDDSDYMPITITDLDDNPISVRMHYQDMGEEEDPVVVLIHGSYSSSQTFLPWAERLVEEGYRVIVPDLPFYGLTNGFDDNITSYRRSALVIHELLITLGIDTVDIAGNSLGGGVSWFYASEYPEMITSLTLIDAVYPTGQSGGNSWDFLEVFMGTPVLKQIVPTFTPKFMIRRILAGAYGDPDNLTDETIDRYYNILRKEGTRSAILTVEREEEPSFTYIERLESLTMPIYLMWGEEDTWIPVETVDLFVETCNIPSDNIYLYPDLGHVPMEEDPETTVEDYIIILSQ